MSASTAQARLVATTTRVQSLGRSGVPESTSSSDSNSSSSSSGSSDTTAPTVSSYSPSDGATSVSTTSDLTLTFSETVSKNSGNIIIYATSNNAVIETISVSSSKVSVSGSSVTINPDTTLSESTGYYVKIDSGAFKDSSGNSYSGITDSTTWNFTVGDFTPVTLSAVYVSSSGLRVDTGETNLSVGQSYGLILKFSENMSSSGNSITSTLGASLSSISTSDTNISFTYTPGARLLTLEGNTSGEENLTITAVPASGSTQSLTKGFTVYDVNHSYTLISPTGTAVNDLNVRQNYLIYGQQNPKQVKVHNLSASDPNASTATLSSPESNGGSLFGTRVAYDYPYVISTDSQLAENSLNQIGAAYLYEINATDANATWAKLSPDISDRGGTHIAGFGSSVDIKGRYAVVGVPDGNFKRRRVNLYEINTTKLSETNASVAFLSPHGDYGGFPTSVATDGQYVVAGASTYNTDGAVFLYEINTTRLTETNATQTTLSPSVVSSAGDYYGSSVAIGSGYILVGEVRYQSNGMNYVGRAALHKIVNNNGNLSDTNLSTNVTILSPATETANMFFGNKVAIKDGYAVVTSSKQSYLFDLNATDINASQTIISSPSTGYYSMVSTDGNNTVFYESTTKDLYLYKHKNP